jgi:tripartite-type tricarboxylate transporter receptor subunit TctC
MTLVNNRLRRNVLLGLCWGTSSFGLPAVALAQTAYPTKPIRLIVGFAPGGGSDFIARLVATKMSEKLGQPVIVENKPGAGGNMGATLALKSPADGYTLFLAAASYTVNPALYKLPFDSINDITPIAQLARGPFIVAVNPKLPANTVQEMIAVAKKSPGALSYGSAGTGSITHLVSEYFLDTTGTNMLHIPYRGTSPALVDAVAGQVQLVFGTVASTLPFIKSGQLRALAVTTDSRLVALPQVPTMIESGLPNFAVTNWHGIIAPKGVPADIVKKLNAVINDSLQAPGMKEGLESDGLTAASGSPQAFGVLLAEEAKRWGALVKKRGIKVE